MPTKVLFLGICAASRDLLLESDFGRLSPVQSTSWQIPSTMGLADQPHTIVDTDDSFGGDPEFHGRASPWRYATPCEEPSGNSLPSVPRVEPRIHRSVTKILYDNHGSGVCYAASHIIMTNKWGDG